jgi:threonine/homoserine/homoserine lactone efflux protein
MFGIHDFELFLATGVLLNLTPGPDTAYILGRTVADGREAGIASALGICAGSIVHTCAAALGLSAILVSSATAFGFIKLLGGVYLIFLGAGMIIDRSKRSDRRLQFRRCTNAATFRQGALTNMLNPKVALFFLAFLPQFIDPTSPTKVLPFLILGLSFVTTGTLWCLVLAWFASVFSERLSTNAIIGRWVSGTAGALFIFLGIRLAITK